MKSRMLTALVFVWTSSLLALTATTLPADEESFDQALALARANLASPEGARYDEQMSAVADKNYERAMEDCFLGTKNPDPSSFQILLQLGADGKVVRALVKPETNVATCFRDKVGRLKYPKPPSALYWSLGEIGLSAPH